jgi:hypothetical protein
MIVCRPDVIGPTLTVLRCIFLVPCKFVYLNLAFADWTTVIESEHGMFEKELKCPIFEHRLSLLAGNRLYAASILSQVAHFAVRFDAVPQHDSLLTNNTVRFVILTTRRCAW